MSRFTAIPVTDKLSTAVGKAPTDEDTILQVRPPKDNDGIESSVELMQSFHNREVQQRFLRPNKNNSKTCGMELWYEDEELEFRYYVPDTATEKHYRRQLSGHFDGLDLDNVWRNSDKFLQMNEGEYACAYRMQLRNHYFEPVRSPESETRDFDRDPYQTILSEMDTKEGNLRTMVQVLFKPAEEDWTDLHSNNVESYAHQIQEGGGVKTRYFGLLIDDVGELKLRNHAAKQIRKQVNKHAFYVNVRIIVVGDEKDDVEHHAEALCQLYENEYEEVATHQKFTPKLWRFNHEKKTKELILQMATREGTFMNQPADPFRWLRHKLGNCDTMIMTIPEVAGLAHIPSGKELNVDGIRWTDMPVSGTLPADAEKFQPASEEERQRAIERERERRKQSAALDLLKAGSEDDEDETDDWSDESDDEDEWGDVSYDPTSSDDRDDDAGAVNSDDSATADDTEDDIGPWTLSDETIDDESTDDHADADDESAD